jgi:MoxR-vWA-beta-propeller ternary system domain bpX6
MRVTDLAYRGTHLCIGLIIDLTTVGATAAQSRVLSLWQSGSKLRTLPDGRWLLVLGSGAELDAATAEGTLVIDRGAALHGAPNLEVADGEVAFWWHGQECHVSLRELTEVDPSTWIELSVETASLKPLAAPEPVSAVEPIPTPPEPDLRGTAGISELSKGAQRFAAEVQPDSESKRRRRSSSRRGWRQDRLSPAARGNNRLIRLVLRSPLRHEVSRRHAKYLDHLGSQFASGDLNEALRHAIPLGGLGNGALSLRIGRRRNSLGLSDGRTGLRSVQLGVTVQQQLQKLYRQAAQDLERSGRIDEAAFVLAELLNNATECVALLERHKRYKTAALLSENRGLDPALTVRLWWFADDRPRAMRLARKSNSYSLVLKYLDDTDPNAAQQFRLLWVDELESSGNIHGAVAAGWPDPQIRPLLRNAIQRGVDMGDEWSLGIHAYRVALHPSAVNRSEFFESMSSDQVSAAALRFMAQALVQAKCSDPVADREVCTAALRVLVPLPQRKVDKSFAVAFRAIRERVDPIVAADLPSAPALRQPEGPVELESRPAGVSAVHDVVPLTNDRALVALGEQGVRLVKYDGKTVAEWRTPCHRLVPADHGRTVILLTDRESVLEAHVLDLVTRKTRYYGQIRSDLWATNFDGSSWAAVDNQGIAFYDMLSDRPQVVWRELQPGWKCLALQRTADSLAAVIMIPSDNVFPEPRLELRRWELPSMRLDVKRRIDPVDEAVGLHLLADASSIWERETTSSTTPVVLTPSGAESAEGLRYAVAVDTSGSLLALQNADGTIEVTAGHGGQLVVRWRGVDEEWGFRGHGLRLAMWTKSGNVALIDSEQLNLLAFLSVS